MNRFIQTRPETGLPDNYYDYKKKPLLSLTKALQPVSSLFDRLESRITSAKSLCCFSSNHELTEDESAALYLYTSNFYTQSIHYQLNQALRSRSRSTIEPWLGFLKLFHTALEKLPAEKRRLWRGLHVDIARNLRENEEITWWSINSCSLSRDRIVNQLDQSSFLCSIEVINGKNIADYTSDIGEQEVLLLPGTCLRVITSTYDHFLRRQVLYLEEISDSLRKNTIAIRRDPMISTNSALRIEAGTVKSKEAFSSKAHIAVNGRLSDKDRPHSKENKVFSATTFSNGDRYEVPYKDGKTLGYGVYFCANGQTYQGYSADIQANGKGLCTWTNGDRYEGDFQNGKMFGDGTLYSFNECIYEGSWIDGEPHGKGISIWPNGNRYEGYHVTGKMTGNGTFHGVDGNTYRGDLVDGKAHGRGKRIWSNGDQYEGTFKYDKKHGVGVYKYVSGAKYLGGWLNDEMHGDGIFIWSSGTRYEGAFVNGKRCGFGKLIFANGQIVTGIWKNDKCS